MTAPIMTTKTTKIVALSTTANGTPRPQLEIRVDVLDPRLTMAGEAERELSALLYEHAAKAVRATPPRESWGITTLRWSGLRGAVALEPLTGSDSEIDAAMDLLRGIAE